MKQNQPGPEPLPFSPKEFILENGSCITVELKPLPDTITEFSLKITRNALAESEFTFIELAAISAALQKLIIHYRLHNLHSRIP